MQTEDRIHRIREILGRIAWHYDDTVTTQWEDLPEPIKENYRLMAEAVAAPLLAEIAELRAWASAATEKGGGS